VRETMVPTTHVRQIGGSAALLVAAGYLAIIPLFASAGAPPVGAAERLAYHAAHGGLWSWIIGLSVATDLLLIPVALSLWVTLRPVAPNLGGIAAAFTGLFIVLDMSVTWPAYTALASLGGQFAAADASGRALLIAAAGAPSAILSSPLQAVNSILTLSIAVLAAGLAARAAGLGRTSAVTGIATGFAGILSVAHTAITGALSPLAIAATLLTMAWLVATGLAMLRPERPIGAPRSR
jgi:hypothetical protein